MAKKGQHGGRRPGAGRPAVHPEGRTVTIAATVPSTLIERLDVIASKQNWNRSEAITEAIRELIAVKSGAIPKQA